MVVTHNVYLLRAWDNNYAPLAAATRRSIWSWCARNGIILRETICPPGPRHPAWNKLAVVTDSLRDPSATVIWCDTDIVITDPNQSLTHFYPANGIAFSTDNYGICSGFFIARGEWASWFLATISRLGPTATGSKHEQDAIKLLAAQFPSAAEHITQFSLIANPDTPYQSSPPFAYHAWAGDCQSLPKLAAALARLSCAWTPANLTAAKTCRQ